MRACAHGVYGTRRYKGGGAHDIVCRCGHKFCFRCKEEAHRPASCADVRRWHHKNTSESENVNWMIANTKDCPKCGRPIEKNRGCNHMTCDKRSGGCGMEFCWLCMGEWGSHGTSTGGFYKCNKYEQMKSQGKLSELESRRKTAESEINKCAALFFASPPSSFFVLRSSFFFLLSSFFFLFLFSSSFSVPGFSVVPIQ